MLKRSDQMTTFTLTRAELLQHSGLSPAELSWYQVHFVEQMRLLTERIGGDERFSTDAILLLRGLSAMRAQGASADQIKGWFGLV